MAQTATMNKISTGKQVSTVRGPGFGQTINQYVFKTLKPYFQTGTGSITKSITKHMTEHEAEEFKKTLP